MQVNVLNNPLFSRLWASSQPSWQRRAALVLLGTALLVLSAKITIPLHPVPITMQPLAVLFIGMTYGCRLAGATLLLYLIEGACGLPVFAEPIAGIAAFAGPTGGYLIGFLPAAMLSGYLVERGFGRSIIKAALAGFAGLAIIYAVGFSWLSAYTGVGQAIALGVKPFLLLDSLKVLLLASIVPLFWRQANAN